MKMTITEKIIARAAGLDHVKPGDNVWTKVDVLLTHDVCGPGTVGIFHREFGADAKVFDREGVVIMPDHYIFTKDEKAYTDPLEIVSASIENMKPQVEVKTRRVGGTTYPVPVPIAPNRQLSLALRWTTTYASARHGMGMPAAVAAEIIDAFLGQGNVIKKRDDVHKMAQANKAFAHYAWGNNAG